MIRAWLFLMWIGAHEGWITIPDIATEEECHRIAAEIVLPKVSSYGNQKYTCTSYMKR